MFEETFFTKRFLLVKVIHILDYIMSIPECNFSIFQVSTYYGASVLSITI